MRYLEPAAVSSTIMSAKQYPPVTEQVGGPSYIKPKQSPGKNNGEPETLAFKGSF